MAAAATPAASGPQQIGDVELDPSARTVTLNGEPLELTRKEFDLLALLMGQAGRVVSRERLIDEVIRIRLRSWPASLPETSLPHDDGEPS